MTKNIVNKVSAGDILQVHERHGEILLTRNSKTSRKYTSRDGSVCLIIKTKKNGRCVMGSYGATEHPGNVWHVGSGNGRDVQTWEGFHHTLNQMLSVK